MSPTADVYANECCSKLYTCTEVLRSCDSALELTRKSLSAHNAVVSKQKELISHQVKEINHLKNSRDAWYNNRWLMMAIGGLAGGYITYKLRR